MESLVFAINAVVPIVIMTALGYFLKRFGIIGKDFSKAGNRLIFKIFLPVMLFTNVYKIENLNQDGKIILDNYENIHYKKEGAVSEFFAQKNGKWGIINEKNEKFCTKKKWRYASVFACGRVSQHVPITGK